MRKAVDDLHQTIVMVTHDPNAASYADRVVFLADGRIVDELRRPDRRRRHRQDEAAGRLRSAVVLRVTLKNLLDRKFRLILTSLAVVIGVGFMSAGFVLTDTLGNVFDDLFVDASKGIDTIVRADEPFEAQGQQAVETRPAVPDELVDQVASIDGVADAQGGVFQYALVRDAKGDAIQNQAPTFGTSWYPDDESVNQSLDLVRGEQPRAEDEVALDQRTFEDGEFAIGDAVRISFLGRTDVSFELVGVFEFGGKEDGLAGATLAAFTPSSAQANMNRVGQWDSIDVRAEGGLSEPEIRDRIRTQLPQISESLRSEGVEVPQLQAITGAQFAEEQSTDIKDQLSFFNVFLLVFSLIVLFVGAFVIYNTFSITVAQRTRELGLLRALGASGRQVVSSVAIEALVLGVVSSVIGLALGLLIVAPLEALLSAFGVDLPSGPLQILPSTIVISLLVGTIVTLLSAISPARAAPHACRRSRRCSVTRSRRHRAGVATSGAAWSPSSGSACSRTACSAVATGTRPRSPSESRPPSCSSASRC